jgi:hypothetical protein
MPLPRAAKRFIAESFDESKSSRTGDLNNILPFLISLLNFDRRLFQAARDTSMFQYPPHT